jgi:hypothetical protein
MAKKKQLLSKQSPYYRGFVEGSYKQAAVLAVHAVDWALPHLNTLARGTKTAHVHTFSIPSVTREKRQRHFAVETDTVNRRVVIQEFSSEAKLRKFWKETPVTRAGR